MFEDGMKFYKKGIALKQLANFFTQTGTSLSPQFQEILEPLRQKIQIQVESLVQMQEATQTIIFKDPSQQESFFF